MPKSALEALNSELDQMKGEDVNDLLTNQFQFDENFSTAEEVHEELDCNTDTKCSNEN